MTNLGLGLARLEEIGPDATPLLARGDEDVLVLGLHALYQKYIDEAIAYMAHLKALFYFDVFHILELL